MSNETKIGIILIIILALIFGGYNYFKKPNKKKVETHHITCEDVFYEITGSFTIKKRKI